MDSGYMTSFILGLTIGAALLLLSVGNFSGPRRRTYEELLLAEYLQHREEQRSASVGLILFTILFLGGMLLVSLYL